MSCDSSSNLLLLPTEVLREIFSLLTVRSKFCLGATSKDADFLVKTHGWTNPTHFRIDIAHGTKLILNVVSKRLADRLVLDHIGYPGPEQSGTGQLNLDALEQILKQSAKKVEKLSFITSPCVVGGANVSFAERVVNVIYDSFCSSDPKNMKSLVIKDEDCTNTPRLVRLFADSVTEIVCSSQIKEFYEALIDCKKLESLKTGFHCINYPLVNAICPYLIAALKTKPVLRELFLEMNTMHPRYIAEVLGCLPPTVESFGFSMASNMHLNAAFQEIDRQPEMELRKLKIELHQIRFAAGGNEDPEFLKRITQIYPRLETLRIDDGYDERLFRTIRVMVHPREQGMLAALSQTIQAFLQSDTENQLLTLVYRPGGKVNCRVLLRDEALWKICHEAREVLETEAEWKLQEWDPLKEYSGPFQLCVLKFAGKKKKKKVLFGSAILGGRFV